MSSPNKNVIVVGGGNAAYAAAASASGTGASVIMLERAPEDEAGVCHCDQQVASTVGAQGH